MPTPRKYNHVSVSSLYVTSYPFPKEDYVHASSPISRFIPTPKDGLGSCFISSSPISCVTTTSEKKKFFPTNPMLRLTALAGVFRGSGHTPLTAVQLLWVNMIMDTLGALALATEPPHEDLMKRTPVGRGGSFISNAMWRNILGQSFYQFIVIWYLQTEGKRLFALSGPLADLTLNTIIFNSFVFCQVPLRSFLFV